MTLRLRRLFLAGATLLVVHKGESLLTGEHLVDPAYAAIGAALADPRNVMLALVGLLVVLHGLVFATSLGGRAALVVFGIAGVVFTHELHHLVRTLLAGSYYPGTVTGTVVCVFSIAYWRELVGAWRGAGAPAVPAVPAG